MPSYRPWGSTEDGAIEFESLTEDTLDGALEVIRQSFFLHESVSIGVDLTSEPGASAELENLCLDAARDGVSVVAVDVASGQVVGVAFNKLQVRNNSEKSAFQLFSEECRCQSSKALVDFMIDVDARIDLFSHYNVDCIYEVMFLATLPSHGKRRIGELLMSSSIEIARELKRGNSVKTPVAVAGENALQNPTATPSLVSAIMTSKYSQKIAKKCGFESLLEVGYDEFTHRGKKFSERIGNEHPSCLLVAKRLP